MSEDTFLRATKVVSLFAICGFLTACDDPYDYQVVSVEIVGHPGFPNRPRPAGDTTTTTTLQPTVDCRNATIKVTVKNIADNPARPAFTWELFRYTPLAESLPPQDRQEVNRKKWKRKAPVEPGDTVEIAIKGLDLTTRGTKTAYGVRITTVKGEDSNESNNESIPAITNNAGSYNVPLSVVPRECR